MCVFLNAPHSQTRVWPFFSGALSAELKIHFITTKSTRRESALKNNAPAAFCFPLGFCFSHKVNVYSPHYMHIKSNH
jgi:tRNA G37 N-methylase Trm5